MTKAFVPATRIPGCSPMFTKYEDGSIHPVFDRHGRQQFNMPPPVQQVIHFNTVASKRIFNKLKDEIVLKVSQGIIETEKANKTLGDALRKAAHKVPVYKGMSAKDFYPFNQTARAQREQQREALKKRMEEWVKPKQFDEVNECPLEALV